MRIGVIVPVHGPLIADGGVLEMAIAAEQAGADGLWVGDHIVMRDEATGYPFNETGKYPVPTDTDYFESLTLCAMMAAVTERCRIGTAVMVLPQRNVLQLAKTATTIDAVSDGRFVLGVGAGWFAGEFEALGYDFRTRGRRMDEMLEVLSRCWTGRVTEYRGKHLTVPDGVIMRPTPRREAGIPTIVGGLSNVALQRAARADGWMGLGYVARFDLDKMARERELMLSRLDSVGRGRDDFELQLKLTCPPTQTAELPCRVKEAANLGYDEIIIEVPWALGKDEVVSTIRAVRDALPTAVRGDLDNAETSNNLRSSKE